MLRSTLLPVLVSSLLLACGGGVERVPDPTADTHANGAGSEAGGGGGGSGKSAGGGSGGSCTAAPSCNDGDAAFKSSADACLELNGDTCYERSTCGVTIWCRHTDAQCDGYPECNPGETPVTSCIPDAYCQKYSACGVTIYCMKQCEGPQPICDQGDTQVSGPSACLQDDAKCYSRTTCDFTIWCTGPA